MELDMWAVDAGCQRGSPYGAGSGDHDGRADVHQVSDPHAGESQQVHEGTVLGMVEVSSMQGHAAVHLRRSPEKEIQDELQAKTKADRKDKNQKFMPREVEEGGNRSRGDIGHGSWVQAGATAIEEDELSDDEETQSKQVNANLTQEEARGDQADALQEEGQRQGHRPHQQAREVNAEAVAEEGDDEVFQAAKWPKPGSLFEKMRS